MTKNNNTFSTKNSYSQALFELANESNSVNDVENQVSSILELVRTSEDIKEFIKDPTNKIEDQEIEDQEWGRKIVVDFASRYMQNLRAALTGNDPSYAWHQYYYLADHPEVSRTRAVVVAMVAHLTLDLPYSLVAIDTTEDHKNDYFVLGELMIEITPDFIDDLLFYYDTDAEDLLNGFFLGEWVDGVYGSDTTITLSYQTIRTKSWNNRWYLEQWWGGWIADSEIYAAFWAIDGVLATLDASGAI